MPEMTWQPIETAPKDGTHVLLWCVDEQGDGVEAVGMWTPGASGWTVPVDSRLHLETPTHWCPVPSPPLTVEGAHA